MLQQCGIDAMSSGHNEFQSYFLPTFLCFFKELIEILSENFDFLQYLVREIFSHGLQCRPRNPNPRVPISETDDRFCLSIILGH